MFSEFIPLQVCKRNRPACRQGGTERGCKYPLIIWLLKAGYAWRASTNLCYSPWAEPFWASRHMDQKSHRIIRAESIKEIQKLAYGLSQNRFSINIGRSTDFCHLYVIKSLSHLYLVILEAGGNWTQLLESFHHKIFNFINEKRNSPQHSN